MRTGIKTVFFVIVFALVVAYFSLSATVTPDQPELNGNNTSQEYAGPAFMAAPNPSPVANATKSGEKPAKQPVVELTSKNTVSLRGVVTAKSVTDWQQKVFALSNSMSSGDTIYLVLDTPGGSIVDGYNFIDTLNALPQKFKTVTIFAASMGFHMVQNLDERIILPSGILMSHRASIAGLEGTIPGSAATSLKFSESLVRAGDIRVSSRLGMNLDQYYQLVRDEYWVYGSSAKDDGMVDSVKLAKCSPELTEQQENMDIETFFGVVEVTFSKCPLVRAPIAINMKDLKFATDGQEHDFMAFFNAYLHEPTRFTNKYVVTGRYREFLP